MIFMFFDPSLPLLPTPKIFSHHFPVLSGPKVYFLWLLLGRCQFLLSFLHQSETFYLAIVHVGKTFFFISFPFCFQVICSHVHFCFSFTIFLIYASSFINLHLPHINIVSIWPLCHYFYLSSVQFYVSGSFLLVHILRVRTEYIIFNCPFWLLISLVYIFC